MPSTVPSSPGATSRYLVAYSTKSAKNTKLKTLIIDTATSEARTTFERPIYLTPAVSVPLPGSAVGGSFGRILARKHAEHSHAERDAVKLADGEHVEGVADGDARQQREPAEICGDHGRAPAPAPVDPGSGVHPEQQARQPDQAREEAHVGRARVQREHGDER